MSAPPEPTELPDPADLGMAIAFGPTPARVPGSTLTERLDAAGRYRMLGEIGRGGVGIVYRGRDVDLGRDVAMKVLRDEYAGNVDVVARFVEEAQIGGQLQHPGIVPVYELGLHAGERPYFAMKLVQGETLATLLRRRVDPAADRRRWLGIFEQVCQTMAYAHTRQVVHRDLKPANVMVGAFGEVQVVDWGLAKVLQGHGARAAGAPTSTAAALVATARGTAQRGSDSAAGSVMGTPAYMAPEQAAGPAGQIDARADVFALGAMLCEILTGEPPYRGTPGEVLELAERGDLADAWQRLAECGADDALVALTRRCLAPVRNDRPETADAIAASIGGYLTSVEERARAAELHAARARYRARAIAIAAGALSLSLVVGIAFWLWVQREAQHRRNRAQHSVATATAAASGLLGQARASRRVEPWDRAVAEAEHAVELARDPDVVKAQREDASALLARVRREHAAALGAARRQQRDDAMRERLLAVRMPVDENVRSPGWEAADSARMDRDYARAFATFLDGVPVAAPMPSAAMGTMRDSSIVVELAAALDHWAMVRGNLAATDPAAGELTRELRRVASALDAVQDRWRTELRAVLSGSGDLRAALERLAGEVDLAAQPAVAAVLLGEALWRCGAHDRALGVYRRAQEVRPDDFGICFRLAVLLEQDTPPAWSEVVATYRVAHALRVDQVEVLHRMGMALGRLGRAADALRVFEDLCASEPQRGHWHFHVGHAQATLGRWDDAAASYRRSLDLTPDHAPALANLGGVLARLGHHDEALASCRRAIAIDPAHAGAHVNLAVALHAQGDLAAAEQSLRRAVALAPDDADAWLDLARVLQERGDLAAARSGFERAVRLDPTNPAAHHALGALHFARGDDAHAIASLRRALELDPRSAATHNVLGAALRRAGDSAGALPCFERAVELAPDVAMHHTNLGVALAESPGRLEEAEAHLRTALRLRPHGTSAQHCLAGVLSRQGRADEALALYRALASEQPRDEQALVDLGAALLRCGEGGEALEVLSEAVAQAPANALAHAVLATARQHEGDADGAIASYRQALALDPSVALARNNLGGLLCERGRFDEGIACFEEVLRRDATDVEARANLGDALARQGRLEGALAEWRRALALVEGRAGPDAARDRDDLRRRIARLEQEVVASTALRALVHGARAPANAREWSDAVQLGHRDGEYRAVAQLTERVLATHPDWAEDGVARFVAARCAALAAAAPGDDADRAHTRRLALAWLHADVARWSAQRLDAARADEAGRRLRAVEEDDAFAAMRGDRLAGLDASEREAWQGLWRALDDARSRARQ